MTATVGATLSTVSFPLRHGNLGPFISSGGNVYFFGRDTTNTGNIEAHKASNPMSSFAVPGTGTKLMSSLATTAIEAADCYQVGNVIHMVTQISTGQAFYNNYTMDTDAWLATTETVIAAAAFAPSAGTTGVSIVVRSNGNAVIAYNAGLTAMSSGFHMVRYRERTATNTYSTATNVDNGGSTNWLGPMAALGSSDRVHFFFKDDTLDDLYQRTLSAANALQTFPAALDTSVEVGTALLGNAFSFNDSGTTRVACVYDASGQKTTFVRFDSADTPGSATSATNVSGTLFPRILNSQPVEFGAADTTNLYVLFSDTVASDLNLVSSTNGGTSWGATSNELAATINNITSNVYTRSGSKVLAMVLDDGAVVKYAEISIAAAATRSLVYQPFHYTSSLFRR